MAKISPTTYGLLGLLAVRSWTGYELTHQLQRSLRFVWPSSEGHLYREQKRLVGLGWATVEKEPPGARTRNRYAITPEGEAALSTWLATVPEGPRFEIEGMLRLFHADHGTVGDPVTALDATAAAALDMTDELIGFAGRYLQEGGPLWMLEKGVGGSGDRIEWHGRQMVPERLHVIALVIDGTTRLLDTLATFAEETAAEARSWKSPTDPAITEENPKAVRIDPRSPRADRWMTHGRSITHTAPAEPMVPGMECGSSSPRSTRCFHESSGPIDQVRFHQPGVHPDSPVSSPEEQLSPESVTDRVGSRSLSRQPPCPTSTADVIRRHVPMCGLQVGVHPCGRVRFSRKRLTPPRPGVSSHT